ncbi:conserved hypothetical protein [Vibrio jasicida]|uniref:hypothetical protein n=1 Tax=Vibrio jasicida TaxID=766224 RepID=UPI00289489B4|nr:conserved hypothetical protein [Vibrio jasicida]
MKIIKMFLKIITIVLGASSLVAVGQVGQFFTSSKELRSLTIANWQKSYPEQTALVHQFTKECLSPPKERLEKLPIEPVLLTTIYDCGNDLGLAELMLELEQSDQRLTKLAWPLSSFAN